MKDLWHYYHSNDIDKAVWYVDTKIELLREQYTNGYDIQDKMYEFYNEVKQMCYWLVEKVRKTNYDREFLDAIINSEISLPIEDLNYIKTKGEKR